MSARKQATQERRAHLVALMLELKQLDRGSYEELLAEVKAESRKAVRS